MNTLLVVLAGCIVIIIVGNVMQTKRTRYPPIAGIEAMGKHIDKKGFQISKHVRINSHVVNEHIALFGTTGAGKSSSEYIPNLLEPSFESVVVTDIKLELLEKTAIAQQAAGQEVVLFAPLDSTISIRINPLLQCKNDLQVRQLAQAILKNGGQQESEWVQMATPLLTAALLAEKSLSQEPSISQAVKNIISKDDKTLGGWIHSSKNESAIAMWNLYSQSSGASATASGIRTTLAACTQIFTESEVIKTTGGNDLDFSDLRKKPISLYIHVPETQTEYAKPLMAVIYTMFFRVLLETKGRPVTMMLDEFANIGVIPDLDTIITTCRSKEIRIVAGLQSPNQIQTLYGAVAGTILDNLKTKVFYPGLGPEGVEFAHSLTGDFSYKGVDYDRTNLREFPDKTLIIVSGSRPKFADKANFYFAQKRYNKWKDKLFDVESLRKLPEPEGIIEANEQVPVQTEEDFQF